MHNIFHFKINRNNIKNYFLQQYISQPYQHAIFLLSLAYYKYFNNQMAKLNYNIFLTQFNILLKEYKQPGEMIFKEVFIQKALWAIAEKLRRPYQDFNQIIQNLIQNFYDQQESLQGVTADDLINIKIPIRIANQIIQYYKEYKQKKTSIQINKIDESKKLNNLMLQEKEKLSNQKVSSNSTLLLESINSAYMKDTQTKIQIVQTLFKILKNIFDNPEDSKFRQLKKSNNKISKIICQNSCCLQYFKSLGFQQDQEFLYMLTPNLMEIQLAIQYLEDFICRNDVNKMQIERQPKSLTSSQMKVRQSQGQILEILSQLKLFIDQAQKVPLKDRKVKLYMKQSERKYTNQFNPPPKVTNQTYFNEIPQLLLNKWIKIMSIPHPRINQFSYYLSLQMNQQTLIKAILPNQIVIQSYYRIKEPLQNVFDTIQKFAIGDLYLYQTPPKKVFKNMKASLEDLECVPFATIYVGSDYQIHMEGNIDVKR